MDHKYLCFVMLLIVYGRAGKFFDICYDFEFIHTLIILSISKRQANFIHSFILEFGNDMVDFEPKDTETESTSIDVENEYNEE